jgi:hypothetical protein
MRRKERRKQSGMYISMGRNFTHRTKESLYAGMPACVRPACCFPSLIRRYELVPSWHPELTRCVWSCRAGCSWIRELLSREGAEGWIHCVSFHGSGWYQVARLGELQKQLGTGGALLAILGAIRSAVHTSTGPANPEGSLERCSCGARECISPRPLGGPGASETALVPTVPRGPVSIGHWGVLQLVESGLL